MAKNIFYQMHSRASKAAGCRIQMNLNGCHRESLPQPNVLASKIPGARQIMNGAGNKLRTNTAFYITTCSKSGMQSGQREGGKKTEEERQKTKESIWRDKQSWEGKPEKMKSRTYQKYNCRKQRLI